jgi:hypothetical protein
VYLYFIPKDRLEKSILRVFKEEVLAGNLNALVKKAKKAAASSKV